MLPLKTLVLKLLQERLDVVVLVSGSIFFAKRLRNIDLE